VDRFEQEAYLTIIGVTVTAFVSGYLLLLLFTDTARLIAMGLGGVFAASLLSHATMVARDIFVPLFLALTPFYSPVILGASAGIGGAIGDIIPYLLGLGVAETVKGKGSRVEDLVGRWIKKYGLWAVLIVAMTPLPDLPIVMLAGTRRLPFAKLVLIEAIGKTILYSIGAFVGGGSSSFSSALLELGDKRRNGCGQHRVFNSSDVAAKQGLALWNLRSFHPRSLTRFLAVLVFTTSLLVNQPRRATETPRGRNSIWLRV